jgi:prepilin-type N-terminal cleavage/methylation domain-containing protein
MRPTGNRWLGPKQQTTNISGRQCIARRCGRAAVQRRVGPAPLRVFIRTARQKRSAGLTLIELLVVLMIIAAISALITTSVLSALNQQNQRVCLNNMLTIEAAKDEYIRDHPGATSIDKTAFQQYFRFGIPTCPDQPGVEYGNLYNLTQTVTCSKHPQNDSKVSASPSPQ